MSKLVGFLVVAALLAGCGGSTPSQPGIEGAHLRGTVTMNGQPVAGAIVTAMIGETPLAGSTTSDAAGRFCLAVPTFSRVVLRAHIPPPDIRVETWAGFVNTSSGDFGSCETAPEVEIVLRATPI